MRNMNKWIVMGALALSFTKTIAQNKYFYLSGQQLPLIENNDLLLIRMHNQNDNNAKIRLLNKLKADANFNFETDVYYKENREYYLLKRNVGSTIDIKDEINLYKDDPAIQSVNVVFDRGEGIIAGISNELVVKGKKDVDLQQIKDMLSQYPYENIVQDKINGSWYHVFLGKYSSLNVVDVANGLYETGNFEIAAPNFFGRVSLSSACSPAPDDLLGSQWNLTPGASNAINICPAWDLAAGGNPVAVAVVDVGVDLSHEDLVGRLLPGIDETGGSGTAGHANANQGHGTKMTGIIAANSNNSKDIAGVALSTTKVIPVRAFLQNNDGSGLADFDDSHLSSAINHAVAANADIINCSWNTGPGTGGSYPLVEAALWDAFDWGRGGKGCVVIVSAGNNSAGSATPSAVSYPGTNGGVYAVGNMDHCMHRHSDLSPCDHTGASSYCGTGLKLVAPGVDIPSLVIMGEGPGGSNMETGTGSSQSAATVSGVAALILTANSCLTAAQVYALLSATADKIGAGSYYTYTSEWNNEVGFGKVNAGNAVTLAHDMYRQNKTLTTFADSHVGQSVHKTFAGYSVTSAIPTGYYDIGSGVYVSLYAPESVNLMPGFVAQTGSVFTAAIRSPCNSANYWWKGENPQDDGQVGTDLSEMNGPDNIRLYPNPAHTMVNVSYALTQQSDVSINIINILGQKVHESNYPAVSSGAQVSTLPVENLTPGTYFVVIKIGDNMHQIKFIKE